MNAPPAPSAPPASAAAAPSSPGAPGLFAKLAASASGWWSVPVAAAVYLFVFAVQYTSMRFSCEGEFVYALDDAYIHLAMARAFARDGVWGVTSEGFAGASSSPLWVLLLGGGWMVCGDWVPLPLVLNLVGSLLLLAAVHRQWSRERLPEGWSAAGLSLVALAAPLPALTLSGMEHVWHHLLLVLWWGELHPLLASTNDGAAAPLPRPSWRLWLLTAILPLVRLESAFLILGAGLSFLLPPRPRWRLAILLPLSGAVLFALFGWWSTTQGGGFLPNSIALKGNSGGLDPLKWFSAAGVAKFVSLLSDRPELPAAALWIAALASHAATTHDRRSLREAALLLFGLAAHVQLAGFGWLFRYESYLVVLTLLYAFPNSYRWWTQPADGRASSHCAEAASAPIDAAPPPKERSPLVGLAAAAAVAALLVRSADAAALAPFATRNIYEQQVQTARFLSAYYPDRDVAAIDIGAVCYFNPRLRILDLFGLATQEVADLRKARAYTSESLQNLARKRGVPVAVSFDRWPGVLEEVPKEWIEAGTWTISQATVSKPTIYFYAVDPAEAPRLVERLREFSAKLPLSVRQGGRYTLPGTPAEVLAQPPTPRSKGKG